MEDAELWFLEGRGEQEASKLSLSDIESISIDMADTPDAEIRYCEVQTGSGNFKAPTAYLWLSVNENNGAPPIMKLARDLGRFTGSPLPVKRLKKLIITKNAQDAGFFGGPQPMEVRAELVNGETVNFTMGGYYSIFAMGARGMIHILDRKDLKAIEW